MRRDGPAGKGAVLRAILRGLRGGVERIPGPVAVDPPVLVATVLGLGGAALQEIVGTVRALAQATGAQPVFVTDGLDLVAFFRARVVVETLPWPAGASARDEAAWRLYRREQLRRMAATWRPRSVVEFGRRLTPEDLAILRGTASTAQPGTA